LWWLCPFQLKKLLGFELGNDFSFCSSLFQNLTCKRGKEGGVYWGLVVSLCCKGSVVCFWCGDLFVTRVWAFHTHHVTTCEKFAMVF